MKETFFDEPIKTWFDTYWKGQVAMKKKIEISKDTEIMYSDVQVKINKPNKDSMK
jgi:hypothetical protein